MVGGFLVVDPGTGHRRWSVSLPSLTAGLADLQPNGATKAYPELLPPSGAVEGASSKRAPIPLAIRVPSPIAANDAAQLMPLAPDASTPILPVASGTDRSLSVVLHGAGVPTTSAVLGAIAGQHGIDGAPVIVITSSADSEIGAELERLFPGRHRTVPSSGDLRRDLAAVAATEVSDDLLIVDASTILHDARTLQTLRTMISYGHRVASAGCGRLRELQVRKGSLVRTERAGYFPVSISLFSSPQVVVGQPDVIGALPVATYPVLANDFDCVLVRRDLLRQATETEEGVYQGGRFCLRFALETLKGGWHHLCTTGVRATSLRPDAAREDMDPLGLHYFDAAQWADVLNNVTLVRELR